MQNTKPSQHYRQGDVLVERIASLPKQLKKVARKNGRLILAHGSATGHNHAIASVCCDLLTHPKEPGSLFLQVRGPFAHLEHDEHATIALPKGAYRVVRQSEYSPESIRQVQD